MLLPFRNVTRTPANDWLVSGAPLMLGEALGQFTDLTIVSEQRLTGAMRRLSLAPESELDATQTRRLAEETGGWTAITGNVIALGNKLRITAQAQDIPTSRVLTRAHTEVVNSADIREAFDRLTVQLLQSVGVHEATSDLAGLTTQSIDAYRSYVDGVTLVQHSAFKRGLIAFNDAVRRDSTFALAWMDLALTAVQAGGWTELLNPFGLASRAAEQAVAHSSRLTRRQAALIRVMQGAFHAAFGGAHLLADSLLRTDAEDVSARAWVAIIELLDSRLDSTATRYTRAGSFNRSIEMVKGALARDPNRLELYFLPATMYAFSAGFMSDVVGARRHELGSLAAEFITMQDVLFKPVLRDSIVFLTDSAFSALSLNDRTQLRLRAAQAGAEWINRWLVVSPNDPEAHLWASRFAELSGDYQHSLDYLVRSQSLKPESNLENLSARRLALLELTGQYPQRRIPRRFYRQRRRRTRCTAPSLDRSDANLACRRVPPVATVGKGRVPRQGDRCAFRIRAV